MIPDQKTGAESHAGSPNVIPGLKIGAESHAESPNVIPALKNDVESHAKAPNVIPGLKIGAESHGGLLNASPAQNIGSDLHEQKSKPKSSHNLSGRYEFYPGYGRLEDPLANEVRDQSCPSNRVLLLLVLGWYR